MNSEDSLHNLDEYIMRPELKPLSANPQHTESLFRGICSNKEHLRPWIPFVKQQDDTVSFLKDAQLKNEKAQALIMLMFIKGRLLESSLWRGSTAVIFLLH